MESSSNSDFQRASLPFSTLVSWEAIENRGFSCSLLEIDPAVKHYGFRSRHLRFSLQLSGDTVIYPSPERAPFPVDEESVFVTPPGVDWEGGWKGRSTLLIVKVSERMCREIGGRARWHPRSGNLAVLRDQQLAHGLRQIYDNLRAGAPSGPLMSEHMIKGMAAHYLEFHCRNAASDTGIPTSRDVLDLDLVEEYIEANIGNKLTLDELAAVAGISVNEFSRRFKRRTGFPPHQYVMKRRVERAKQELRSCDRGLNDLALALGFYDQSQFTNTFKRRVGLTPQAFRHSVSE